MSIHADILEAFPQVVQAVTVDKGEEIHGEPATRVVAYLANGRYVEGTFTTESKPGFGGVDFQSKKDIAGLMGAKIRSVLEGTHEEG